ncbi:MAG: 3-oxoacyl-[acyl-carrier-protein] reductase [Lachnospiraceae bacterium]|nr:3-oxoacyl-[acyl-carrier-protein] reductase [Lachnospiraceae bacterium]
MSAGNRTALVTGAGRGIGRAAAIRLAEAGFDVAVHYGHSLEGALETAELCRAKGVQAVTVQADIADSREIDRMFDEVTEKLGTLTVLVNNAGITKDGLILRMKEEDFLSVIDTNLFGSFLCMKKAAKLMLRAKYGRIINVSSIVGLRGNAGQVNYAASKAGVIGMTKSLAKELAAKNITVNAVAPGMIATEMTKQLPDSVYAEMEAGIPAGRIGTAEDVAEAIAFFASEGASYVTGQVLAIDGGMAV